MKTESNVSSSARTRRLFLQGAVGLTGLVLLDGCGHPSEESMTPIEVWKPPRKPAQPAAAKAAPASNPYLESRGGGGGEGGGGGGGGGD